MSRPKYKKKIKKLKIAKSKLKSQRNKCIRRKRQLETQLREIRQKPTPKPIPKPKTNYIVLAGQVVGNEILGVGKYISRRIVFGYLRSFL